MDITIDASGTTTTNTTSATSSEHDRTSVVQEALPTVERDSETVTPPVENTPLPESTMIPHYPFCTRKLPERYSTLKHCSLGGEECSDRCHCPIVTVLLLLFYI